MDAIVCGSNSTYLDLTYRKVKKIKVVQRKPIKVSVTELFKQYGNHGKRTSCIQLGDRIRTWDWSLSDAKFRCIVSQSDAFRLLFVQARLRPI